MPDCVAERTEFELPVTVLKCRTTTSCCIFAAEESRYKQMRFKPDSNSTFASRSVAVPI